MTNGRLFVVLSSLMVTACSSPNNDGKWKCNTNDDCLAGWICGPDLYCQEVIGDGGISDGTSGDCKQTVNGVCGTKLVMGISAAITTGPTGLGLGMSNGIKAYFKQVNDHGYDGKTKGIHGRTLELKELDDGYVAETAQKNCTELTKGPNRQVFAVMGNVGTPTAKLCIPVTNANATIFFGAFTGAGLLRNDPPDKYVFNFRASYKQETSAHVKYLTQTREPNIPPKNIAVYPQGTDVKESGTMDSYGQAGFDGVHDALKKHGLTAAKIMYATYDKTQLTNVSAVVRAFLKWLAGSDSAGGSKWGAREKTGGKIHAAIVGVPTYEPFAELIKKTKEYLKNINTAAVPGPYNLTSNDIEELKNVGDLIFISVSFVGSVNLAEKLKNAGMENCPGVLVSQVVPHYDSSSAIVDEYKKHLAAFDSKVQPGFVSLEGYLAARLFVEGLQKHGTAKLTSDSLVKTLESLSIDSFGLGERLSFTSSKHQAINKVWGTSLDASCVYQTITNF